MNDEEFKVFWSQNSALIKNQVTSKVDRKFIQLLDEAFGILGAVTGAGLQAVMKNHQVYAKLTPMAVLAVDFTRAALVNYHGLCLSALWLLQRSALENYLNLRYIAENPKFEDLADQYARFGEAEKLRHDKKRDKTHFTEYGKEVALSASKEWLKNADELVPGMLHWLGPGKSHIFIAEQIQKSSKRQEDAGLVEHVRELYWLASNVTHAGSLSGKLFQKRNGVITPFGSPEQCAFAASGVSHYSVKAISHYADLFGIRFPNESYERIFNTVAQYISKRRGNMRENA